MIDRTNLPLKAKNDMRKQKTAKFSLVAPDVSVDSFKIVIQKMAAAALDVGCNDELTWQDNYGTSVRRKFQGQPTRKFCYCCRNAVFT